jgi:hypothetical protein
MAQFKSLLKFAVFAVILAALPLWMCRTDNAVNNGWAPPANLLGDWQGSAQISSDWTRQRQLPVVIHVAVSGSLNGRIGDAQIAWGMVEPNRGTIGRFLNFGTDYRFVGQLNGSILSADDIRRNGFSILCDLVNGRLVGDFVTSGWLSGDRNHVVVTAEHMVLTDGETPGAQSH